MDYISEHKHLNTELIKGFVLSCTMSVLAAESKLMITLLSIVNRESLTVNQLDHCSIKTVLVQPGLLMVSD